MTQAITTPRWAKTELPFARSKFILAVIASQLWLYCLAVPASCEEGARLVYRRVMLLNDVLLKRDIPLPLQTGAVGSPRAPEGTCGGWGRAGGTQRATRVVWTRATSGVGGNIFSCSSALQPQGLQLGFPGVLIINHLFFSPPNIYSPSTMEATAFASVVDSSWVLGGEAHLEKLMGVGTWLGLILNINLSLIHTFFFFFCIFLTTRPILEKRGREGWRERGGSHVEPCISWLELNSFSLNLAPKPFFIQIYIPTREYIPTIHSVHVTIQMLLASQ